MPRVNTRNEHNVGEKKIRFNFDVHILNALILYTQCEYVSTTSLYDLKKLIDYTNPELYRDNQPIYARLATLQSLLNSMVELKLENLDLLKSQLRTDFEPGLELLDDLGFGKNLLRVLECEKIDRFVSEKLQCIEIYQKKDQIASLFRRFEETADYNVSYHDTIQDLKMSMSELLSSLQNSSRAQGLLQDFAFSAPNAANEVTRVVHTMQKPTAVLQTGIRQLNAILAPGFQGGRLYTILGGSGKFKSGTLLNLADQIRRFNPQITPFENGMRKCVLFITMENSIEETIERLFDMYSDMNADLRASSPEDVINILRDQGNFRFNGGSGGIDIYFKYAGNLEINTGDIYGYVSDLNNKGYSPIAIVLDYIKRIDSAHNSNGDERVRMSFVAKELKEIAHFFNIPVITAMQLNREGNGIIDAAMRDSKQDVARFVGSSSIGNAWDIIEDSDWVCLINLELQKSTGRLFLTFKRLKIRGKKIPMAVDYFNHPFVNAKNIRLDTDVDKPEPISIISLANDLESIKEEEERENEEKAFKNLQSRARDRRNSSTIVSALHGSLQGSSISSMIP